MFLIFSVFQYKSVNDEKQFFEFFYRILFNPLSRGRAGAKLPLETYFMTDGL